MIQAFRHLVSTAARSLTLVMTGFALSLGIAQQGRAQQYGARIFWLAPSNLNAVQFQSLYQKTNTAFNSDIVYPNLDINTTVLVATYSRTFAIGHTSGQFVSSFPYASADAQLSAGSRGASRSASGLADSYAHLRVGLVGTPALTLPEYAQYLVQKNPQVQMYALVGVYIPTGEYNPDRSLDLHIQHQSPGADQESNWLPAPAEGLFNLSMHLSLKMPVVNGTWAPPALKRVS
jgi:hypothetical protein